MPRPLSVLAALAALLALAGAAAPSDAQTASSDPAARGLDLFVHVPDSAAPGSRVPVQLEAFGFPTAVTLSPLAGVAVEAGWDPEHLGPGVSTAPPSVRATTDAAGRARFEVLVPDGDERALELLVGVRSGGHARTRTVKIQRGVRHLVALHVADTRVVPGSTLSAWVMVSNASSGEPAAGAPVELALVEGGLPRTTLELVTDAAGTAMARVPIPEADEPSWSWQLRARSMGAGESGSGEASATLTPREETPGTPRLVARFDEGNVLAGDRAAFTVWVRDATDQPIAGLPLRYWIGPKGTEAPKDDKEWARVARAATTDAEGRLTGATDAPTLVARGVGTTLQLVVKTEVEGHALEEASSVSVGVPTSTAQLLPEAGHVVPGVEQRLLLRVYDARGEPVAASFSVEGDGLAGVVTTGAEGDAEVTWRAPAELGAHRNVGPCAGGVAASVLVRPRGDVPALRPRTEPWELCLPVDREATAMVKADRPIARSGDRVRLRVIGPRPEGSRGRARPAVAASKTAWSVVLRSGKGEQAASLWIEDGEQGAEVELPPGEPGAWSLSAAAPDTATAARVAAGTLLVTPRVLPFLAARVAGGRAAPGGAVDLDADLTDGKGLGLQGTVAAVMVDLHGGGSTAGFDHLDTRRSICRSFGVRDALCDRFADGDPALDPLRRGLLGEGKSKLLAPASDPGGTARDALTATFGEVLRSLEGAVYEATQSADQLRDVRRRGRDGRGFVWNPELMTLVTAALTPPPLTPGGEPLTLADLLALDPQVTFDNVARRVTRLKLFRVLSAVRAFRHEHQLDADEPVLRDPNALLRKLVREERLAEDLLLDPWGGTIRFVPASGPALPFLSVIRGFELHAPGPDGVAGTGDDVRDPFERVLRSGTPYAKAVQEDRLVDAKLDMEVGEATVSAWQTMLESLTGTALGNPVGAIGHGTGGGTGQGFGSGHGRLGGSHRSTSAITTGVAWWSPPVRTDAAGHVRFRVPLGDAETTWRIALIGVPDGARQATTFVDVPVALPLSARVDTGASWIEGDTVEAAVTLRNRTARPAHVTLALAASGAAQLVDPKDATRAADVAAGGAAVVRVPVRAGSAGAGELAITARAPGLPDDVVHHAVQVLPAGEPTDLTRAQWVEGEATLAVPVAGAGAGPDARAPMRLVGHPRLVLERGLARPLAAALESLDPDRLRSRAAQLDAIETAARVQRWATSAEGDGSPLAVRASDVARRARGRLGAFAHGGGSSDWLVKKRLQRWVPPEKGEPASGPQCPPPSTQDDELTMLDAEPTPESGAALACWDAFVSSAMEMVTNTGDPVALARAFLAVSDRPHRAALAATLIDRLREQVALRPSGAVTLPATAARSRASRATVYAALLDGVRLGKASPAPADRLAAWLGVQRDADGGYGSAAATRLVVRALLGAAPEEKGTSRVTVKTGATRREIEVPPSARVEVPLDAALVSVDLELAGPGLVARLERPVVRPWSRPPEEPASPLSLDVTWPSDARAGTSRPVVVSFRHSRSRATTVDVRLPLPPGVSLAEPVSGVRQVQGALSIRRALDASGLPVELDLPMRFGLAGRVTVPEARAWVAFEEAARVLAPARPLTIK